MNPLIETLTRELSRGMPRDRGKAGAVYVIHFDESFHHAQHYVGWTGKVDINSRMDQHLSGNGSRLMRAVSGEGIKWEIVRIFYNADRHFERWVKQQKQTSDFCPVCNKNPRQVRQ